MTCPPDRPETIEKLDRGVYPALAMLAGMELDLFTPLKDGPMTYQEIARALGGNPDKLRPLLYSLVDAGLLTVQQGRFTNTPESQRFLVRDSPDYMGGRRVFFARRWSTLLRTAETVRTGIPQGKLDYSTMSEEQLESYYRSIYNETASAGRYLLGRYDFSSHRHLVDVGGGSGGLAVAMTDACPGLKATVIDLPNVTQFTRRFVNEAGAGGRVQVTAADALAGPIPGSYDVAVLRAFLPVLSAQQARQAVKYVGDSIQPSGAVYVVDGGILDDSRLAPKEVLANNLGFINQFDQGEAHTEGELREWLTAAGCTDIERISLPNGNGIIRARKPG